MGQKLSFCKGLWYTLRNKRVFSDSKGKSDAWARYSTTISIDGELIGRKVAMQEMGENIWRVI